VTNSLERLIAGMIATLRAHVIPNVADDYARGQALGIIDLLNNIAPRVDWARAPLAIAVAERRRTIAAVRTLLPQAPAGERGTLADASSAELIAERDRLDAEIVDLIAWVHGGEARGEVGAAMALLRQHVHDDLEREMKLTRKPLFAEISKASGGRGKETG